MSDSRIWTLVKDGKETKSEEKPADLASDWVPVLAASHTEYWEYDPNTWNGGLDSFGLWKVYYDGRDFRVEVSLNCNDTNKTTSGIVFYSDPSRMERFTTIDWMREYNGRFHFEVFSNIMDCVWLRTDLCDAVWDALDLPDDIKKIVCGMLYDRESISDWDRTYNLYLEID